MKIIPLTQGKEAIVDDCDYDFLMQWKWCYCEQNGRGYARHTRKADGHVSMHRLVAERSGFEVTGREIDHRDTNSLHNCRANLRVATTSQNQANRSRARNNKSGFKGVFWELLRRKWRTNICVSGKRITVGRFDDKIDAARAYNKAAIEHFGEFACLNPV